MKKGDKVLISKPENIELPTWLPEEMDQFDRPIMTLDEYGNHFIEDVWTWSIQETDKWVFAPALRTPIFEAGPMDKVP